MGDPSSCLPQAGQIQTLLPASPRQLPTVSVMMPGPVLSSESASIISLDFTFFPVSRGFLALVGPGPGMATWSLLGLLVRLSTLAGVDLGVLTGPSDLGVLAGPCLRG